MWRRNCKPEPAPLVRAFDDSGNVGDDEGSVRRELHDAEVGAERRERVVADLGTRGRDHRQQRRLPGVRLPDEADVGDELELELQRARFAVLARLVLSRRLVRRRGEVRVALSAAPAARHDDAVAILEHLADSLRRLRVGDDGAHRNRHDDVARPSARSCSSPEP